MINSKLAKAFRKYAREVTANDTDARIVYNQMKSEFEALERTRKWQRKH